MNILIVSECSKRALQDTRRVLDQFAERKGTRTWQTHITYEGMQTLRKMLRKTARKNTAVACHWLKKTGHSELLWTVGRRHAFDSNGNVPTNTTKKNLLKYRSEHTWQSAEIIALAAAIAGLFHDVGKANTLFQKKLQGPAKKNSEPFRHEWVSLRLFTAFVGDSDKDEQWLHALLIVSEKDEANVLKRLIKDQPNSYENGFSSLKPALSFARCIAWLIVSHHRLPLKHVEVSHSRTKLNFDGAEHWLETSYYHKWNANNADGDWQKQDLDDVWRFPNGTPMQSATWQKNAHAFAKRALLCQSLTEKEWLHQRFTSHLARLSLMLADHVYSSLTHKASKRSWQDPQYAAYANTEKCAVSGERLLKQKLDEHNIGVAYNALFFARHLPSLRDTLPTIDDHRPFSQRTKNKKFDWQNKAYETTYAVARSSRESGFFGINMASTGYGKTLANARIMYALAEGKQCRFNVALGLRTLTLQTGDAYRALLELNDDDLAVLVGSQAVRDLHDIQNAKNAQRHDSALQHSLTGSTSEEDFCEDFDIRYDGEMYDGRLKRWLAKKKKLHQLISAPIVVSTIDHLMPATESLRGGKQIGPILRLLTSDLILDEPDDFGLEDLPALCRLVNWAGVFGGRVLLSSATIPPSLVYALFEAYNAGRQHFNAVHASDTRQRGVVCAWFDEFNNNIATCHRRAELTKQHEAFVDKRSQQLAASAKKIRRRGMINIDYAPNLSVTEVLAHSILQHIQQLHQHFSYTHSSGKTVSLGVVRMANINPMLAVAQALLALKPDADTHIHYCVYHSQYPLALRSYMEARLDASLSRHDLNTLWQQPEITKALHTHKAKHHIFVVLGTAVVEVGRDHDYDWAIAEPSSLRSLIQLAGRVQRHRQQVPSTANVLLFDHNIKALQHIAAGSTSSSPQKPAYCRPGFETHTLMLATHDVTTLMQDQSDIIDAQPRIQEPDYPKGSLNGYVRVNTFHEQEHRALVHTLFQVNSQRTTAELWWNDLKKVDWHGELIRQTPFRRSQPTETFTLRWLEDEGLTWYQRDDSVWPHKWDKVEESRFRHCNIHLAEGVSWWFDLCPERIYSDYAEKMDKNEESISERYGELEVTLKEEGQDQLWHWHPMLGAFQYYDEG